MTVSRSAAGRGSGAPGAPLDQILLDLDAYEVGFLLGLVSEHLRRKLKARGRARRSAFLTEAEFRDALARLDRKIEFCRSLALEMVRQLEASGHGDRVRASTRERLREDGVRA